MHNVEVTTKARAESASLDTLFTPGGTATTHSVYCAGKYQKTIRGRILSVTDDVVALYTVVRRDKDGPYHRLMAIHH